jgi:hypothetical protein
MAKTNTPTDNNVNTNNNVNNNTNHVNVNVHVPRARKPSAKKEVKSNGYNKLIVGGIITLVVSVSGFYIKQRIDLKNSVNQTVIQSNVPAVVETTKH